MGQGQGLGVCWPRARAGGAGVHPVSRFHPSAWPSLPVAFGASQSQAALGSVTQTILLPLCLSLGHVSFKTVTSFPFSFQNLLKSQAQVLSCIYSAIYIFLNSLIVYKWTCRRVRRYTDAVNSRLFYQASRLFSCNFNTCIVFCCIDVS